MSLVLKVSLMLYYAVWVALFLAWAILKINYVLFLGHLTFVPD